MPADRFMSALADQRHAERYRGARGTPRAQELRAFESTRTRAGWLLVGLGLRLVAPGAKAAAQRARLIGQ